MNESGSKRKRDHGDGGSSRCPDMGRHSARSINGMLDSERTQQLMERLLLRVTDTRSPVALLDITGVPTIDTQTAQHLIETIQAVRYVGADVVMTGVRPAIAQTLVHLGVTLSHVITRSSLRAGLVVALQKLNLHIVSTQQGT
jgi:rsbT co-antagonist protein RsbR